jgi:hypothetical protein
MYARLARLSAASRYLTDWEAFYGIGGRADLNFSTLFQREAASDYVHNDLFTDILKEVRNVVLIDLDRLSASGGIRKSLLNS